MKKCVLSLLALMGMLFSHTVQAQNVPARFAPRMQNLTDLTPLLERKDLTPVQRTEILLMWLAEERRKPSETRTGLGGGDIDSGYIQIQIVKALFEVGDRAVLEWIAIAPQITDQGIRDAVSLALGIMGDRRQAPTLLNILRTHPIGHFRAEAAQILGSLGVVEARAVLQRAKQDEFAVKAGNSLRGIYTSHPVSEAAERALRMLDSDVVIVQADEREEKFVARLKESQENARKQKLTQARFIAIANRRALAELAEKPGNTPKK